MRAAVRTILVAAVAAGLVGLPARPSPAQDLPGPSANLEMIPAGSLVIPMDNAKQSLVGPFNTKAYGLVVHLLWDEIPVKWAIKAGKSKDGIDFTAGAKRIFPTSASPATLDFKAGPFVIDAAWADYAKTHIAAFGNSVAVYELTDSVQVDVRYTLTKKPKIAVFNDGGNASIHTAILAEAGFVLGTHYEVIPVATLATVNATVCFTAGSEPHFGSSSADTETEALRAFIESGGNLLAQCEGVKTYENNVNFGRFQTTLGVVNADISATPFEYPNADLAFSQFEGALADIGGSLEDLSRASGSSFQNGGHIHVRNVGADSTRYVATGSKLVAGVGGDVFYLGGHNYGNGSIEAMNGRRMYLNFALMPSGRPASCGLEFTPDAASLRTIAGTVWEDVNGDSNLGDAVGKAGVRVRLYTDSDDDGKIDSGDVFMTEQLTASDGTFSFGVNTSTEGAKFLVAVDSRSVAPQAGFNGGSSQADVWAQQTYGDDPTTGALDVGSRYGGRLPGTSDNFNTSSTATSQNQYQHVGRADVTSADVAGLDFGFSFNVVTNARGGDNGDDDGSAARTIQGSLRQFLQNANAIAGANAMRFVPATATNASGGGGSWWRITVSTDLPVFSDTGTTLDGTCYDSSDGTTARDENPGTLGTGGTVGVDAIALVSFGRPELEIIASGNRAIGLSLQAASSTVRGIALYGFGDTANSDTRANILVGDYTGAVIEGNVLGAGAAAFSDPASGAKADNVRIIGDSGTIRDNLIGFSGGNGLGFKSGADGWLVEGNEIAGNAVTNADLGGILANPTTGTTVRENLFRDNKGPAIDLDGTSNSNTMRNNTVHDNGIASSVKKTPGIRIRGSSNTIDRNVIHENYGAGVMIRKEGTLNTITKNSMYDNGTILNDGGSGPTDQIGIDLNSGSDNNKTGTAPYVSLNDSGDGDGDANGLLNYPVIQTATTSGGILTVTGWARPGSAIEFFVADPDPSKFGEGVTYLFSGTEGSGSDLDATTGSYGPGRVNNILQGQDTTNRFQFQVSTPPGVVRGTLLTATATLAGATSEFSGVAAVDGFELSGTVREDPNGDSLLGDAVGRPGVIVHLQLDGGDGVPDGVDDIFVRSDTTDAGGAYSFMNLGGGNYWLYVDSKTVSPSAGFNGGSSQGNVWAVQTYGPAGSWCTDGAGGTTIRSTNGTCYGGRTAGTSDNASALSTARHVAQIDLSSADVTDADFAFSFGVVTNARGGDNGDDDGSAARTIQGSLRQFLANANAIAGSNAMRFVPVTVANTSGGGGSWWRIPVSSDLPAFSDASTTLDGTCYDLSDGTSLRDENPGVLGTPGTVGVDAVALVSSGRPELEIVASGNRAIGLSLQAASTTVRGIALYGFGDTANSDTRANILVGDYTGTLIEGNVIGAGASSFTDPASGANADNIRILGDSGTIRDNLIGFSGGNGLGFKSGADAWLVEGNEIAGNAITNADLAGILANPTVGTIIRENLVRHNKGPAIDLDGASDSNTMRNNTVHDNGIASSVKKTPGLRIRGSSNTIDRNVIYENYGAGVMIRKEGTLNTITKNSMYDNGTILNDGGAGPTGQVGIDLNNGGDDNKKGTAPFYTINDSGDTDGDANGLLNFPVLDTAVISGVGLTLTGWARPGSTIELFVADPDTSGFGEGRTYVLTAVEGSGSDQDASSSSYGPGAVNGLAQGQDTTNRFQFVVFPVPAGLALGVQLTATATLSASTSEFSGVVTVTGIHLPDIALVKSVAAYSDSVNGLVNPKAIPGATMLYTLEATNEGLGTTDTDSIKVTDAVPANTAMFVGDIGLAGSGPVEFEDGTVSSGLTYTFTSLASTTDDVEFSADGGSTWAYVPTPDAAGFDPAVTHVRIRPKGALAASDGTNDPSFRVKFRVRVQ